MSTQMYRGHAYERARKAHAFNKLVSEVQLRVVPVADAKAKKHCTDLVEFFRKHFSTSAALDINLRHAGAIILMCKVNGQDMVQTFFMQPNMSVEEWKRTITELDQRFGFRPEYIDSPKGMFPHNYFRGHTHNPSGSFTSRWW